MRRTLEIISADGGMLSVTSDSNTDYPDYIRWHVRPGMAFGILDNTAATRRFLRRALARLEKDAKKRKPLRMRTWVQP